MVSTARLTVLLGIVLLSCIQSVVNENADINTLSRIQRFIHRNYASSEGQYAVAINVPKEQCRSGFLHSESNFLRNDRSENVRPHIRRNTMDIYRGNELIATAQHPRAHSEHLLMNPPNNSPLTDLMNRRRDGCVVFYTLNSPCIGQCLNSNTVISGLRELRRYQGIKAFVYTYVYHRDQNNPNLPDELKKIADHVPLYRCDRNGCILCGQPGSNTPVIDQCISS